MRQRTIRHIRTSALLLGALFITDPAHAQGAVEPTYVLPFAVGYSSRLIQGNDGPWGHSGHARWAFDFVMPIGSKVAAARAGVVVKVESRFPDNTRKGGDENFVFVRHADGTFARYYHLTTNGVLVDSGAVVRAGDVIALSGNSGASAGAHLHFDVTRGCAEWGCETIPIRFANSGADSLRAGQTYTAQAVETSSVAQDGTKRDSRASRVARAGRALRHARGRLD